MPRPSLADVRRPQLLDAYARCLVRFGAEGSTLDRIAEEAGVTRALVRHYLGNRSDVDRALVTYVRERGVRWFLEIGEGLAPSDRLDRVVDALFEQDSDQPGQVVDTLLGAAAQEPALRTLLREMYLEWEHLLDADLAAAYPDADPARRRQVAYAILCLAGMHGSLAELGFPDDRRMAAAASARLLAGSLGD
jgi:AcrR family transcriptional regulator